MALLEFVDLRKRLHRPWRRRYSSRSQFKRIGKRPHVLKRKGFDLAPSGWYYVRGGDLITIYLDGHWQLDSFEHEQPTIEDLKDYLLSLPDRGSPAA